MKYEISKYNPCVSALQFRARFTTFKEAWETCPRGDWMLWIAQKLNVDIKILTLAKVECAKTIIHLMKDERSLNALEVAEIFALTDEVTLEDLRAAYAAAAYAAYAADADAAAYAADADAAAAAADAADAAAAAYAADAAAYAADAAADAATKTKNQKQTAKICRKILTKAVFEKLNIK